MTTMPMMCPLNRLSNAMHDRAVRLYESHQYERAIEVFHESLATRIQSVKAKAAMAEGDPSCSSSSSWSEAFEKANAKYIELQESKQELSRQGQQGQGEEEDLAAARGLDIFPVDGLSPLRLPPPRRMLLLTPAAAEAEQKQEGKEEEKCSSSSRQEAESARTLHNMALCHLYYKDSGSSNGSYNPNTRAAGEYLSLAEQALLSNARRRKEEPLLVADILHAKAIVALADNHLFEAERCASEALGLYHSVVASSTSSSSSATVRTPSQGPCYRHAQEGEADALSLVLRIRHVAGYHQTSTEFFVRGFEDLIALRSSLHGRDSIQVAATMCSFGIVVLSSSCSSGQSPTYGMARECIENFVDHRSVRENEDIFGVYLTEARYAIVRFERALEDDDYDSSSIIQRMDVDQVQKWNFEEVLGVTFYQHAAAA